MRARRRKLTALSTASLCPSCAATANSSPTTFLLLTIGVPVPPLPLPAPVLIPLNCCSRLLTLCLTISSATLFEPQGRVTSLKRRVWSCEPEARR